MFRAHDAGGRVGTWKLGVGPPQDVPRQGPNNYPISISTSATTI